MSLAHAGHLMGGMVGHSFHAGIRLCLARRLIVPANSLIDQSRPGATVQNGLGDSLVRRRISAHDEIGVIAAALGAAQPGAPFRPPPSRRRTARPGPAMLGSTWCRHAWHQAINCICPRSTPPGSSHGVPAHRASASQLREKTYCLVTSKVHSCIGALPPNARSLRASLSCAVPNNP